MNPRIRTDERKRGQARGFSKMAGPTHSARKMPRPQRIYVAGHRGMVGGAIVRALLAAGENTLVTRTHAELDLTDQSAVRDFFAQEKPDQVYLAAAKVGGIHANNMYPSEFIYENLMMEANIIDTAFRSGTKKLLFLGSSCIYPRLAEQPMREDALLTGTLEPTNEPYAIAKIAGIKLCESYNRQYGASHGIDYRSAMPTNLYGPGDNYHPENSHVIPALIRRFHEAKENQAPSVAIWGSGTPKREFLFVDDLADGLVFLMKNYSGQDHINIGTGKEMTIRELAERIAKAADWQGRFTFDTSKPDGTPRKVMDVSRLAEMGWTAQTSFDEAMAQTYRQYASSVG